MKSQPPSHNRLRKGYAQRGGPSTLSARGYHVHHWPPFLVCWPSPRNVESQGLGYKNHKYTQFNFFKKNYF